MKKLFKLLQSVIFILIILTQVMPLFYPSENEQVQVNMYRNQDTSKARKDSMNLQRAINKTIQILKSRNLIN